MARRFVARSMAVLFQHMAKRTKQMPEKASAKQNARPPASEVHSLWKSSLKLHEVPENDPIFEFLSSRNLDVASLARTGVARVTPKRNAYAWPKWWPGGRSMTWRLIVPAFDSQGRFCSIQYSIWPIYVGCRYSLTYEYGICKRKISK